MFKFCVAPGVNSNVASNLLVDALKTKTIPLDKPPETSTSLNPAKVPPLPDREDITLLAFLEPTLTFISDILINL